MIDGKYEYFAFISYKEEDAEWAKWLQRKLEHYKLPTALRKDNPDLPERISPIYEYKSEAGGGRLKEAIWNGLTSSRYLIVICSPRATKSEWLNNGIRYFVESGQEESIIPFIVEGKPKVTNPDEECFPSELLKLTGDRELRGININEMGRDAAAVKVVSQMFKVKFDSLWQRYKREKKRMMQLIIVAITSFAFVAIGIAGWIWHQDSLLKEKDWKIMENQARFIAEKADELINAGDSYLARLLLLDVMPKDEKFKDRPLVKDVDSILIKADKYNTAILNTDSYGNHSVAFCNNDLELVSVLSTDKGSIVKFWDSSTGTINRSFEVLPNSDHMSLTKDFKRIAVWGLFSDKIGIYSITGRLLHSFRMKNETGKGVHVTTVTFGANDRVIVSTLENITTIWDLSSESPVSILEGTYSSVSNNGCLIALTESNRISIYDLNTKKTVMIIKKRTVCLL